MKVTNQMRNMTFPNNKIDACISVYINITMQLDRRPMFARAFGFTSIINHRTETNLYHHHMWQHIDNNYAHIHTWDHRFGGGSNGRNKAYMQAHVNAITHGWYLGASQCTPGHISYIIMMFLFVTIKKKACKTCINDLGCLSVNVGRSNQIVYWALAAQQYFQSY